MMSMHACIRKRERGAEVGSASMLSISGRPAKTYRYGTLLKAQRLPSLYGCSGKHHTHSSIVLGKAVWTERGKD